MIRNYEETRNGVFSPARHKRFGRVLVVALISATMLLASGVRPSIATAQRAVQDREDGLPRRAHPGAGSVRAQHGDPAKPGEAKRQLAESRLDQAAIREALREKRSNKRRGGVRALALVILVVTNTSDSGAGSLRQAILNANVDGMPDQIVFNIPLADPGFAGGVFTIKPTTALPVVFEDGTSIDGATQTAFTGDTNPTGPEVVITAAWSWPARQDCDLRLRITASRDS